MQALAGLLGGQQRHWRRMSRSTVREGPAGRRSPSSASGPARESCSSRLTHLSAMLAPHQASVTGTWSARAGSTAPVESCSLQERPTGGEDLWRSAGRKTRQLITLPRSLAGCSCPAARNDHAHARVQPGLGLVCSAHEASLPCGSLRRSPSPTCHLATHRRSVVGTRTAGVTSEYCAASTMRPSGANYMYEKCAPVAE